MALNQASTEDLLDFSKPWELSDVVLVVEEERFYVHRSILGIWSPVFSRMFTAEFKEKTAEEVPLPGKKASEITEMLLVIYPTCGKSIDDNNYVFLLKLAKEYMMTKLTKICEKYLMDSFKPENPLQSYYGQEQIYLDYGSLSPSVGDRCLELLDIAQTYGLESLQTECINKAKYMRLQELKRHDVYKNISSPNYRAIVEGMIENLERDLRSTELQVSKVDSKRVIKTECDRIKSEYENSASSALKELEIFISILVFNVCKSESYYELPAGIDEKLKCIQRSGKEFKNLYGPLKVLCDKLKSFSTGLNARSPAWPFANRSLWLPGDDD